MNIISALFKVARTANDIRSVAKVVGGDVGHGVKRVGNKIKGRFLGKIRFWG